MSEFSLKQLEVFAAVAELNSFTLAAQKLFLTQSTVSSHIGALEKALGAKLLSRDTRRSVNLTTEGERLYPAVKKILESCESLQDIIRDDKSEMALSLGASTLPAQYFLPELLSEFLRDNRDGKYLIKRGDSSKIHSLVRSGEVRIGFVGTMLSPEEMTYVPLAEDELVLVTANNDRFWELQNQGVWGRALLFEPMVAREEGSGTDRSLRNYMRRMKISPDKLNVVARAEDPETIKYMVAQGAGVAVLSSMTVKKETEEGKLLMFKMDRKSLKRKIYMIYRQEIRYSNLEHQFIDFVKETVKKRELSN